MSDAVLYFKRAPSLPIVQTVTGSPYVYVNLSNSMQVISVTSGNVTLIEINAGSGFLPAIGIAGTYVLMPSQSMRVNYLITPPSMTTVTL
jgi:hypothetical protein